MAQQRAALIDTARGGTAHQRNNDMNKTDQVFVVLLIQCGIHSVCRVFPPGLYEGIWSPMDGYNPQVRSEFYFQSEDEATAFAKRLASPDRTAIWGHCCDRHAEGEAAFLAELEESERYAEQRGLTPPQPAA
jgi:hypothetical protein